MQTTWENLRFFKTLEVVYVTIRNSAFCLLYLTGEYFRGELKHVGDVSELKIKFWPLRTREIGGVRLQDGLYVCVPQGQWWLNLLIWI